MMTLLSLYPSNCGNKNTQENIMTIVQLTYGTLPRTTILFLVSCHLQSRHRHHCLHPRIRSCPFDETWRNHAHQTSTSLVQALRRKKPCMPTHTNKKTKITQKAPQINVSYFEPQGPTIYDLAYDLGIHYTIMYSRVHEFFGHVCHTVFPGDFAR